MAETSNTVAITPVTDSERTTSASSGDSVVAASLLDMALMLQKLKERMRHLHSQTRGKALRNQTPSRTRGHVGRGTAQ